MCPDILCNIKEEHTHTNLEEFDPSCIENNYNAEQKKRKLAFKLQNLEHNRVNARRIKRKMIEEELIRQSAKM